MDGIRKKWQPVSRYSPDRLPGQNLFNSLLRGIGAALKTALDAH
ncbi:hypothetical protein [Leeia aquatica]|nr:hypothetical protein [Leeia aquatica]